MNDGKKILITQKYPAAGMDLLKRERFCLTFWEKNRPMTPEELTAQAKTHHALLSMENVCVLPHVGSGTMEARDRMSALAAENIIAFYKTGRIPHIINPKVLTG
jgi:lactate dehydrogenase-like 2-hydroxyacid dehydrogenase